MRFTHVHMNSNGNICVKNNKSELKNDPGAFLTSAQLANQGMKSVSMSDCQILENYSDGRTQPSMSRRLKGAGGVCEAILNTQAALRYSVSTNHDRGDKCLSLFPTATIKGGLKSQLNLECRGCCSSPNSFYSLFFLWLPGGSGGM